MDLDEYLWRNKIKQKDFACKVGIQSHSLSNIVKKKVNPSLYVAMKIVQLTEGQVDYIDLLKEESLKRYKEW